MEEVILYSTGCPKCEVLKKKLDQENVRYTVNTSLDVMRSLGILAAPALSINGRLLLFSEAIQWVNSVGAKA